MLGSRPLWASGEQVATLHLERGPSQDGGIVIDRLDDRWVVTMGDRRLEGRAVTTLLEALLGPHDPRVMPLTFEALAWAYDLDHGTHRDTQAHGAPARAAEPS
jgi:hypothetical protein